MTQGRQTSKSEQVKCMFAAIAPRYDLLNHLLSLNTDRSWRRFTVKKIRRALELPGALALDLCCGTADLSLELQSLAPVIGIDFCHPMLLIGKEKIEEHQAAVELIEGDAQTLPFPDDLFAAVTIAFGLRNLDSPERGLKEMLRVLKPSGVAAVLEFSQPTAPVFSRFFLFYFRRILPRIGSLFSGVAGPYQYLRDSVQTFFNQQELAEMMRRIGFANVRYFNLTGGVAALHLGEKI